MKKILLTYGKAMKKRPRREGKKKVSNPKPKGLRLRKTVRGRVISPEIVQINLKILKEGQKKLSEIFPEQNKPKEVTKEEIPEQKTEEKSIEKPKEQSEQQSKKEAAEQTKEETTAKKPEQEEKKEESKTASV